MRYLKQVVTLAYDPDKCIGCGLCAEVCPHAVFRVEPVPRERRRLARVADRDACMECGACMRNCPAAAIRVHAGVGCASGLMHQALGLNNECACCTPDHPCA